MSRPTDSMWRITTAQGLTTTVDSATLVALCRSLQHPRSIELLRGQAAEDARHANKS
jgi:hypothetical protein